MNVPPTLFSNEDVTKWGTGIHAHGKEKAVEYLRLIWSLAHAEGTD